VVIEQKIKADLDQMFGFYPKPHGFYPEVSAVVEIY